MKKRIVILFPWEWVAYSPSILNLVDVLSECCEIRVLCFDNHKYNNNELDAQIFQIIRIPSWLFKATAVFGIYRLVKFWLFRFAAKKIKADIVIGVDGIGMCAAQAVYGGAHFFSLEVEHDYFFRRMNLKVIQSIAIQTKERLDYLFPHGIAARKFYLPNSPILTDFSRNPHLSSNKQKRVILFGNVTPSHGVLLCIDAIVCIEEAALTLKGIISRKFRHKLEIKYQYLIKSQRLFIDDDYIPQSEIVNYLRQFDAGFCFYDFNLIKHNDFNYKSSPSGKMYNYFAAEVPVIGSDIIGLRAVKEFEAGILLSEPSPNSIRHALYRVFSYPDTFRQGCLRAAKSLNFAVHAEPYKDFLISHRVVS